MIKTFRFNDPDEIVANSYVIGEKDKGCVIIDLGRYDDRIRKYIKENHNSIVNGLLLTHGHFDHISGINDFLKEYSPTLFIKREEEKLLTDTRLNCSCTFSHEIVVDYSNKYLLDDEDEINFGNGYIFKVIETKGHTEGSVCYLLNKENALFSGDTLFKNSIGRCDLPTGSIKDMRISLEKLSKLDANLNVYPGHGEPTILKKEVNTLKSI